MTKLDSYKPARHAAADSRTPRAGLLRLAQQEMTDGYLFNVCAWCHPPAITPEIARMPHVTHGICSLCSKCQTAKAR